MSSNDPGRTVGGESRQRVEKVAGARRARLTPAPGTDVEPDASAGLVTDDDAPVMDGPDTARPRAGTNGAAAAASGPNDERMRRDVPPHY